MGDANRELAPAAHILIQRWWPGAKLEADGTYRVGGLDQVDGSSGVVFPDGEMGPRFYDNNDAVNMDFLEVAQHKEGHRNIGAVLKTYRADGTIAAVRPRETMGSVAASTSARGAKPVRAGMKQPRVPSGEAMCGNFALGLQGTTLSLNDLDESRVWAPADPWMKKCIGCWRHSTLRGSDAGVRLARFGGHYESKDGPMELQPWMTRAEILRLIEQDRYLSWRGAIPTFCLTGSPGCLWPRDALLLDVDVKSDRAEELRDAFMPPIIELGCSVFASGSGRGRHILARVDPEDFGLQHFRGLPPKDAHEHFRIEIFPAGTKRQVVWHRDQQLSGAEPGDPLPRLPLSVVNSAALRAFGFLP